MPSISTLPLACRILGAMMLASGCSVSSNQGNGLLEGASRPGLSCLEEEPTLPHQSYSLSGFDRSGFPRATIRIPMASVETFPTYSTPVMRGQVQADSKPFPNTTTALQRNVDPSHNWNTALLAPLVAATDLLISPARMISMPPWTIQNEPTANFELLPPKGTTGKSANPCEIEPSLESEDTTHQDPRATDSPEPADLMPPRADTIQRTPDAAGDE